MRMAVLVLALTATPAAADSFGGFSGVDAPYLVNSDRVCTPLPVASGAATGAPACQKAAADVIAKLSIKEPIAQRGAKADFAASASGKALTVTRQGGDVAVTWNAPDPIGKIVEVYASQYGDRVAVAYTVRRLGKEVTDVVAFELTKTTGRDLSAGSGAGSGSAVTASAAPAVTNDDPTVMKAVADAKKAAGPKALAAWKAVIALDASHGEALYRIAALQMGAKLKPDAISTLEVLAKSPKPDAIEWLVEARFDPAFAGLRADPKFRAATGLDRKASTPYEHLMGFGGQWEQTGTSCDKPEVHFVAQRDRSFKLRVKTVCEGQVFDSPFKGTWRFDGPNLVLTLPNRGQKASVKDDASCKFEPIGDEDSLRCTIGRDLEFVVLPTRR